MVVEEEVEAGGDDDDDDDDDDDEAETGGVDMVMAGDSDDRCNFTLQHSEESITNIIIINTVTAISRECIRIAMQWTDSLAPAAHSTPAPASSQHD